jgi:hypothetical protein
LVLGVYLTGEILLEYLMGWLTDALAALKQNRSIVIRPTGNSMRGKIESGCPITLAPVDPAAVSAGDIVLVAWKGTHILHLVHETTAEELLIANALGKINGWVSRAAAIGRVIQSPST